MAFEKIGLKAVARGSQLHLEGDADKIEQGAEFSLLQQANQQGFRINASEFLRFLSMFVNGQASQMRKLIETPVCLQIRKEICGSQNFGQKLNF